MICLLAYFVINFILGLVITFDHDYFEDETERTACFVVCFTLGLLICANYILRWPFRYFIKKRITMLRETDECG